MAQTSQLRVFDLTEFVRLSAGEATTGTTIAQAITLLQAGKPYTCPKCSGIGGFVPDGGTNHVICDVCDGYGKTVDQYESYVVQTAYRKVDGGS